jgi:metal-dependent HD superfamily phosphatase/phosphodiesterase
VYSKSELSFWNDIRKNCPGWIYEDLMTLAHHSELRSVLDLINVETTKQHIKKHGMEHAMKVIKNALSLYEPLRKGLISPELCQFKMTKYQSLMAVLTAALIHDFWSFL